MNTNGKLTFREINRLFAGGTVILFKCRTTQNFPVTFISENCADILGYSPSYFLTHQHGWAAHVHPDDLAGVTQSLQHVARHGGELNSEYRFMRKDGGCVWLKSEFRCVDAKEGGSDVIVGTCTDISRWKKAEAGLTGQKNGRATGRRAVRQPEEPMGEATLGRKAESRLLKRLAYEQAISKCSNILLESSEANAIDSALGVLAEATGVDRVYLFENHKSVNGDLCLSQVSEACAEGVEPQIKNPDLQNVRYEDFPWWHAQLSRNKVINAVVRDLPSPEKEILQSQDIKSVLVLPVFVDKRWYGFIGFDDTRHEQEWDEDIILLLKTASEMIAACKKRQAIEASLVRQKNYTRGILSSLPGIYLALNKDLELTHWNANVEKLTGYTGGELTGTSVFDIIVADDRPKLEEAAEQLSREKVMAAEIRLLTKSGKEIDFYWVGQSITLEEEHLLLCIGVDITRQKKIEQELLDEKRFSEAVIDSLPGIFYMFGKEGKYLMWNENFIDQLGYDSEEVKVMGPADVFDEESYKVVEKAIQEVFRKGEVSVEEYITTKSGSKVPYHMTGKLFKRNGKEYLLGTGYDISEEKQAVEQLKKSEELFRNLFLKAPAAIVMVDVDNNVLMANKSFERLFGYTENELVGKDLDAFVEPSGEDVTIAQTPVIDFDGAHYYHQAQRRTKSGELKHVFIGSIPIYVDDEPFVGFVMYIDITEQVKYENEISSSLQEKQVLLQEIHHRVKNNLAVVSGLIQLQMYEVEDSYVQQTLQESQNRVQTMALIHEKLYQSQNLARISCRSYIEELIQTIKSTFCTDTKKINIVTDIENVELNINKAVPFALLLNEVISNAFKHAFAGRREGEISVRLFEEDARLHVSIRDDGIGLPTDFSIEASSSLGMTLIHNFLHQLEAEWELHSGEGTELNIVFSKEYGRGSSTMMV